ncbi:MAG: hypothetical protein KY444_11400 [Gemmatimonadetes bacterium]|nr:hypothetical protein [Gemmatimonadota bacterium]
MQENVRYLALAAAVGLALVHVFAGRMRFLEGIPRSRWLSFAGGVSVSYVFLHLLPELARGQEHIREAAGTVLGLEERHVYLVALFGLAAFYGLERMAVRSRRGGEVEGRTSAGVFRVHIASFALYNALIGYLLLHREENTPGALALFFAAMALHFVVNDSGLREHHGRQYHRWGRWIVAAAVLLGCGVGLATEIPEAAVAVAIGFLAGGVILNVLKEELPEERQSRFGAMVLGMAGYAALLLAI